MQSWRFPKAIFDSSPVIPKKYLVDVPPRGLPNDHHSHPWVIVHRNHSLFHKCLVVGPEDGWGGVLRHSSISSTMDHSSYGNHLNIRSQCFNSMASYPITTLGTEIYDVTHVILPSENFRIAVFSTSLYSSKADHRGSPKRGTLVSMFSPRGCLQLSCQNFCIHTTEGGILLLHGMWTTRHPVTSSQT